MNSGAQDLLDSENRQRADRLAAKVSQLKSFAVDIERETKEHNLLLDESSQHVEGLFGFMSSGRNRLNRLLHSNRGNRRLLCYLVGALTVFLFFGYALIHRALSNQAPHAADPLP